MCYSSHSKVRHRKVEIIALKKRNPVMFRSAFLFFSEIKDKKKSSIFFNWAVHRVVFPSSNSELESLDQSILIWKPFLIFCPNFCEDSEFGIRNWWNNVLEPSFYKKWQKSPNQETGLENSGRLKFLNDTKLILND